MTSCLTRTPARRSGSRFILDLYKLFLVYWASCTHSTSWEIRSGDGSSELIADGELTSGAITAVVQDEFGISQPAVSQHLKVLRDSGFATVRPEGTRRLYAVDSKPFRELDDWLDHFRRFWDRAAGSLATELARGKRERRLSPGTLRHPKETIR